MAVVLYGVVFGFAFASVVYYAACAIRAIRHGADEL